MQVDEGKSQIDESLYSRQLYVMGHDAQRRVGAAAVLLVGADGLGVEIAKNVVLAGVKLLTVFDNKHAQINDLGSQFYLNKEDCGKPRSVPTAKRLAELNEYVRVESFTGDIMKKDFISNYDVVVVADEALRIKLELNDLCRQVGTKFICCSINGLFCNAFCDFGDKFTVLDTNGEQPITRMLSTIIRGNPTLVTVHDESRHGLETGEVVRFSEIQGMVELNSVAPQKITVKGPFTFEINVDSTGFGEYKNGGYVHQVKQPREMSFKSLRHALEKPGDFLLTDFGKLGRPELLHFAYQALEKYRAFHLGAYPEPGNVHQCNEVIKLIEEHAAVVADSDDADVLQLEDPILDDESKAILVAFASGASAALSPMAAYLGGVVGQEVLKAVTGKFTPLHQWLYFDAVECLPDGEYPLSKEELAPIGSRYDAQIAVFGKRFVRKLNALNMFLIGAGAIGCEMLKNWALMGVGADGDADLGAPDSEEKMEPKQGIIYMTDMDKIEKSNLNRQFLFRPSDVGSSKSTAAVRAIKSMNSSLRLKAFEDKVAADTENIFGDDFFASLDAVCTALDNVEARLYVDQRCLNYCKPMLESGTLGTKGNTQIVIPYLTENYGASRDPPEKSVPICTLKNFPYQIEHTIQWARDWFEGAFTQTPRNVNSYLTQADFLSRLDAQQNVKVETLSALKSSLVTEKPRSFEECIEWARLQFEEKFSNSIKQLLFNFPAGMVTTTGAPFWSGTKRQPTPIEFSMDDSEHMAFIIAAANIRAFNYNLKGDTDEARFRAHLPTVDVPPFKPKSGVKIAENDQELKNQQEQSEDMMDVDTVADNILGELPAPKELAGYHLIEAEFEKDDDTNFHMDFITATSNLRARNYGIAEADKHQSKFIAGKIIPAIATTTALVTGLVCLELYKIVQGKANVEAYKNGFCNLALPFFAFSEPIEVKKTVAGDLKWSIWDKIEIDGSQKQLTLADFLQHFQDKYNVEVNMLSYAVSILHSFFSPPSKRAERMKMTMPELVENVTKKTIDPNAKYLTFEVICVDKDDNDVDFPPVRYKMR
uniref:Ubiquitin-activating enzyme E1 C-terminal domain-containing protein n=1 Tax=Mucochytrium quahogii TaxID=96639 RepID=A0A7S2S539_9STRA|mmetsp:Transcript_32235/g.51341  ORF Transcript_32235/g.51341 Transcript_32235/m.51341 type:complete len:1050 (-) Transcript_32235:33-3182(-)|eukprot:CAMPEP_0203749822 /NCGR_PEP_ID=MMETSP0098-20131031/4227_1 /ASSEMBLY_ACC=CAM_ASM_000208 /TAXON_ID=96639 /ORGANISM=" , Strain NY0313808BC1" /LENGTH=1049 /DNA_ID=CAMNT_0050638933 /DNA_START=293 /DNA_END=3442 /DNA_ORIENTATION=+